eukprot:GHVS01051851.1.p1 GENE.GHVS01051851.1~~GHVS01051851.1.p1  ORF type:complete len:715 (+),score=177.33 GHVS01051851.1:55-2145(+)
MDDSPVTARIRYFQSKAVGRSPRPLLPPQSYCSFQPTPPPPVRLAGGRSPRQERLVVLQRREEKKEEQEKEKGKTQQQQQPEPQQEPQQQEPQQQQQQEQQDKQQKKEKASDNGSVDVKSNSDLKKPSPHQPITSRASLFDISAYDLKAHDLEKVIQDSDEEGYTDSTGDEKKRQQSQQQRQRRSKAQQHRKSEDGGGGSVPSSSTGNPSLLLPSTASGRRRASSGMMMESLIMRGTKKLFKAGTYLPPNLAGSVNRDLNDSHAVKVWMGTWNCAYQEFPLDLLVSAEAWEEEKADREEVIGEKVERRKREAFQPREEQQLGGEEQQHGGEEEEVGEEEAGPNGEGRRLLMRTSTLTAQPATRLQQPLADWITPGYGVYVITLQEAISDSLFGAVTVYLQIVHPGHVYKRIEFDQDKISGYGDGALLAMKSTSIACWVREELLGPHGHVSVGSSKSMSLSTLNGSKGAVSIVLRIHKQQVCFIGCHMPAGGPEDRRRARDYLSNRLSELYCGLQNVAVTDVFHHIIWAGDFNLRLHEVSAAEALRLLKEEKKEELFLHDELRYHGMGSDFVDRNFVEGGIDFSPTYKKKDGRQPVDRAMANWVNEEYHTKYAVKWYKGGHQEERCPAWTDRVFKWSMPELESCLLLLPHAYSACCPSYQSVLLASDHSPVGCGFSLHPLNRKYSVPPTVSKAVRLK